MIEVMKCVEAIGKRDFQLEDVYAYENRLNRLYPEYQNVRPKIRQQLQYMPLHVERLRLMQPGRGPPHQYRRRQYGP